MPLPAIATPLIKLLITAWVGKTAYDYGASAGSKKSQEESIENYTQFINSLPEGDKKEFVRIANAGDPLELTAFINQKVGTDPSNMEA